MDKVFGIIDEFVFENDNGWTVLKILGKANKKIIVTITQKNLKIGQFIEVWGNWDYHKKFGKQFKGKRYNISKPTNEEGIQKFLKSGAIDGISYVTGSKIWDEFGINSLKIIEKNPNELLKIRGMSEEKLKRIKKGWKEYDQDIKILVFLENKGLSHQQAIKTIDYFQDNLAILKTNPYELTNIEGIGFNTADAFALKMGIKKDDPIRIVHGVIHLLKLSLNNGHTFLYREQVIENSKKVLHVYEEEYINTAIDTYVELGLLVEDIVDKKSCIFLKDSHNAEINIVHRIKKIIKRTPTHYDNVDDLLAGELSISQIKLSDEQEASILSILKNKVSILTGGAGVGKTTTVQVLLRVLNSLNKNVMMCAPTGRAAQRMSEVTSKEVQTIHRMLRWEPNEKMFVHNHINPLDCDFLIVDETSMMDIFLAEQLLDALKNNCQILFIGDPNQLPSVGAGDFLHHIIESESVNVCKLTKIFRQEKESQIVKYSYEMNEGKISNIKNPYLLNNDWSQEDCFFVDSGLLENINAKEYIFHNKDYLIKNYKKQKDNFNINYKERKGYEEITFNDGYLKYNIEEIYEKANLGVIKPYNSLIQKGKNSLEIIEDLYFNILPKYSNDIQIITPMKKGKLGVKNLNRLIQSKINPPDRNKMEMKFGEKIFREGDKVIQLKNQKDLNIFNGDIGFITDIKEKTVTVSFLGESRRVVDLEKILLEDLDLAYAITVHKSQGSEMDCIIIPMTLEHQPLLVRNLIYTALTRGKKKVIFVGNRKAYAIAVNNNKKVDRQSLLTYRLKGMD
jgi:exodeoxyribonuclease V alpha subunit